MGQSNELRDAYDNEVRGVEPPVGPGQTVDRDGTIFRTAGLGCNMIQYKDLGGIEGDDLDALIARQVAFFAARGEEFEWKTHSHDAPADLPDRLLAAGFVPEDPETVVVGWAAPLAVEPNPPTGVHLRTVTSDADFQRIADLSYLVWGTDQRRTVARLTDGAAAGAVITVAEAGSDVVSYGRIFFEPGRFASLWGGSTLPAWRRKGIYRALVAYRARIAVARGHELIQVDCTEDSRPILERLGMISITSTTPYNWVPTV